MRTALFSSIVVSCSSMFQPADPPTDPPVEVRPPYSPQSRLTNREFLLSVAALFELTQGERDQLASSVVLGAETTVVGLNSDSAQQAMNQITLAQFGHMSDAAVALHLGDDVTLGTFNERVGCADPSVTPIACIEAAAEAWMASGYRGSMEPLDALAIPRITAVLDEMYADVDGANPAPLTDDEALARLQLRLRTAARLITMSPKFVFHVETGMASAEVDGVRPLTPIEIANRLSYFVSGGPPGDLTLQAAMISSLDAPQERFDEVNRLLSTDSSLDGVVETLMRWMDIDDGFASEDDIAETREFLEQWVSDRRPFSDLYTSPVAVFHDDSTVSDQPFGILGLKAVVASHTSSPTPSFINRGEFITERLLCAHLPDDLPDSVLVNNGDPLAVFQGHARAPCATCHHVFDNYGAALQRFDVQTTLYDPDDDWLGTAFDLYPIGDVEGTVSDPAELGQVIGHSLQAMECMTELWYRHALRRGLVDSDERELQEVLHVWAGTDTSIQSLIEVIVARQSFGSLLEFNAPLTQGPYDPSAAWSFDTMQGGAVPSEVEGGDELVLHNVTSAPDPVRGDVAVFDGHSAYAEIPLSAFDDIDEHISLELWVKGDGALLPSRHSLVHASDSQGVRTLNIHLPWEDERVYWDAGGRLSIPANADEYIDAWRHWVFTKNGDTGAMTIFLDGAPWAHGEGDIGPIGEIASAQLGTNSHNNPKFYPGSIAWFAIYNTALTPGRVSDLFHAGGAPTIP